MDVSTPVKFITHVQNYILLVLFVGNAGSDMFADIGELRSYVARVSLALGYT